MARKDLKNYKPDTSYHGNDEYTNSRTTAQTLEAVRARLSKCNSLEEVVSEFTTFRKDRRNR